MESPIQCYMVLCFRNWEPIGEWRRTCHAVGRCVIADVLCAAGIISSPFLSISEVNEVEERILGLWSKSGSLT